MTSDPFRCRCRMPCTERATQEDMLCDVCRRGDRLHMHVGPSMPRGTDPSSWDFATPMTPLATTEPSRITFV